jgi:hypothetical protein
MSRKTFFSILLIAVSLIVLAAIANAAGGIIEGVVSDPKGAVIKDATVTVKNISTNQTFTATTDNQGRYKIEGVPAGTYIVTITAKGFSTFTKESVVVEEGKKVKVEAKLEIAPIETGVTVGAAKANDDPIYQKLRQKVKQPDAFSDEYAVVNNLVLKRDTAVFTLHSGEIYFLSPVEGRQIGAVFIGDGEFYMKPPIEVEQKTLAIFTDAPDIKETVTNLVLRFTDKTYDEIKASPNAQMKTGGGQISQARDTYEKRESMWRKTLRYNMEQRTLMDIYRPERRGFFTAFIGGTKYNKLIYRIDPLGVSFVAPEQVTLTSYGDTDGGIWASFHLEEEYKRGTATSKIDRRLFDFTNHKLDVTIKGTRLIATDRVTMVAIAKNERVIPFDFYPELRVKRVQDENGNDLKFIQEDKDEDADFAVILPAPTQLGMDITLTIEYEGEKAIRGAGSGNFILIPRLTWYPNNGSGGQFGDRATFEINFRYPKTYTLVGVGNLVGEEKVEGDTKTAKWSSGQTELAVAGFNYGRFKKKAVKDEMTGYEIESYANEEVPDELKAIQRQIEQLESQGVKTMTTLGSMSTTSLAEAAIADAQNSTRIYNAYFGKIPYNRIAMTQQPAANFGQAWPTLVYMPYMAFIDTTQRVQLFGVSGGTDTFWRYVAPHEVAHQWWGHTIGWTSYRDQWMSEGFSEFSASLYVQFIRKDINKFIDFWEDQRKRIIEPSQATKGKKPYIVGPVTQGYRLNNAKTGAVAQFMIYPKGAYILHMIRMMMYDRQTGDDKFRAMMQDFIKRHYNTDVSTDDFKKAVEKHILPIMDIDKNGSMNWFFDQWVYGTEIPAYSFEYTVGKTSDGKASLSAKLTQSGVSDNFAMIVPLYVDFGKGWMKLGSITIIGNTSVDIKDVVLPQAPEKAAVCVMNDVLATSIQNKKR